MPSTLLRAATLSALAIIAFILACTAHEAVGHGLACLGTGGKVTLLTSVFFQCRPSFPLVDAAGPILNLTLAAGAALALRHFPPPSVTGMFLGLLLAFSGFWGAGYCIFSAVSNTGDLAFALRDLSLEPRWLWRLGMGVLGLLLYGAIRRRAAAVLPGDRLLIVAYGATGAVACLSVLFCRGPILAAAQEAVMESLVAPVGMLFVMFKRPESEHPAAPASLGVVIAGIIFTVLFWLTLGRGFYG